MNWHKVDQKYDLSKETYENRDLRWICNQIIHIFVFIPVFRVSGAFDGTFVSSDKNKNKCVYYFSRKVILELFDLVGNYYSSASHRVIGRDGQWIIENYTPSDQEMELMLKGLTGEFVAQSGKANL
ncbi:MAG: hypothetical protein KDE54_15765 [Caldilineaceae bacterium]|nr:hypothetical protein [Caldilineaceae bacterium]MCB0141672.1 hypothetical protein [Caldilineaceae bacterium]